jgi:DsbC/DsbD-like thiol-disulfide interchange protein
MQMRWMLAWATVLLLLNGPPAAAEEEGVDLVHATLVADVAAITPGATFTLGVHFRIKPQWHIYWINPGDSGVATTVEWKLPTGWEVGEMNWPVPHRFESSGIVSYGYEDELLLTAQVRVPQDAELGQSHLIQAHVQWLSCKVSCIPGEARPQTTVQIAQKTRAAHTELFETWLKGMPAQAQSAASPVGSVSMNGVGAVRLTWRQPVKDVEVYPATSSALVLNDIEVEHRERATEVRFKPDIYDAAAIPGGLSRILVIYHEAAGARRGVWVPVRVTGK